MTIERLRILNDNGLDAFQVFINQTRAREEAGEGRLDPPCQLLTDDLVAEILDFTIELDDAEHFSNRFDLAIYLNQVLGPVFVDRLYTRPGLWAWIALFYFDQLRAENGNTQRSEHFVPDEWAKQTPGQDLGYRHCVRTPFQLLRDYGEDFARFFLIGRPASQMGDIVEQVVSSPKLLRNERIRATIVELYQAKSGGVKRGAASVPSKNRTSEAGRGGLRRFARVYVPRVKLGYDIDEMALGDIISACGSEISNSRFTESA